MSGHTPGPWHAKVHEGQKNVGKMYVVTAGQMRRDLCHVLDGLGSKSPANDCRLIAAAPDILNALVGLANVAEAHGIPVDAARAAIARAQGIQS